MKKSDFPGFHTRISALAPRGPVLKAADWTAACKLADFRGHRFIKIPSCSSSTDYPTIWRMRAF